MGTEGDWRANYPDYLGCCYSLDENIGRLRATLREQGIEEETIIIYTSDHGSHFKTRNQEYKRSCHEGCIRIPMIVYGPGFMGGKVIQDLVSLIDIPATLLDCAGLEKPKQFQGMSMKQLVNGTSVDWREAVFLQISESQVGRAIRTKEWKYSVKAEADGWADSKAEIYYEEFLYNLLEDPHEKNNLVDKADYRKVREALSEVLKEKILEVEGESVQILPCR